MRKHKFFLLILLLVPGYSRGEYDDVYLRYVFNYVSAQYWIIQDGNDFIKKHTWKTAKDKVIFKENYEQVRKLPSLARYENGFEFELQKFIVRVDIRKLRHKIVYLNDEKLVFTGREPFAHQVELVRRKIFENKNGGDKRESYSLLNILLPQANAEGWLPQLPAGAKQWLMAAIIWQSVNKLSDMITTETVAKAGELFCYTVLDGVTIPINKFGLCRDYLKRQHEEALKNPSATAVANGKVLSEADKIFVTLGKTCPHQRKDNKMLITLAVIDPDFLEKDPDGGYLDRIIRTTSEQKGKETVATYVYENKTEIAVYAYSADKLKTIKVPNKSDNNNNNNNNVKMPYRLISGADELGKNDTVEDKMAQKFHQLVNQKLGAATKRCTEDLAEEEGQRKRNELTDKDKAPASK